MLRKLTLIFAALRKEVGRVQHVSCQNLTKGTFLVEKIISGGQTGVDLAALDIALQLGIPCGGWCPKGRKSEDGPIPNRYPLRETGSTSYPIRTAKNVLVSDGTLVLTIGPPMGELH